MKNVMIIGSRTGASDVLAFDRVETLFGTRALAEDINAVAATLEEKGIKPLVFYPDGKDSVHAYKFIGNYLKEGITLLTTNDFATYLSDCIGAILVGVPAKAGTIDGFCDKTYVCEWWNYQLNGKDEGEIGIYKAFFGMHGIPVLMVSGCEMACKEALEEIPNVVAIQTKKVKNARLYAQSEKTAETIRKEMREGIALALERNAQTEKTVLPLRICIEFFREDYLEDFLYLRGIEGFHRVNARQAERIIDVLTKNPQDFFGKY